MIVIDVKVGDKVKAKKVDSFFGKYIAEGDIFIVDSIVDSVGNDWITLTSISDKNDGDDYMYINKQYSMGIKVFNECFEKYEEPKPEPNLDTKVSPGRINWIMDNCEIEVSTIFDKCTVVTCKLPNGFIIVENSACVDPANYDEAIGLEICMNRIKDKVWELEGYMLQERVYNRTLNAKDCCDGSCNVCDGDWLL